MLLRLLIPCLCVLSISLIAQPAHFQKNASPESLGFSSERLSQMDQVLEGWIKEGMAPNIVTFIARKGQVVHHKTYGYSDLATKKALRSDDIFRIASQTKAIVTVGLMMLYEQGAFLLEDPLSKYLPAFKEPKVLVQHDKESLMYTTRPAKQEISIRDLLAHTSGISYDHPLKDRPEFQVPFFASLEAESLEEVTKRIAARPLLHDPGEQYTYGLGIDVAGHLLEVLSGQALDVYLQEKIFEPLGMNDSHFYLPESKKSRLVQLYSKASIEASLSLHKNKTFRNFAIEGAQTYFSGGAGLVGTIEDYARFCQMMLNEGTFNGARLLSPSTVRFMVRNHIGDSEVWNRRDKFGLGFMIITEGSRYADQAPPGSYKWGGMYCSEYTIDPENELIMLIYTNVHPYAHYGDFVRKFRIMVYGALMD